MTPRLTREASSEDVHDATEEFAWEGVQVIPDRSLIQGRCFHPRHERGCGVAFPLTVHHSFNAGSEHESEGEGSESGAAGTELGNIDVGM
jgi:hypothetical protein